MIERFIRSIADSGPYHPSHPISQWECRLEIVTASETWRLKLVETERLGMLAFAESGQILSGDGLRVLKELIEPADPLEPDPPTQPAPPTPGLD
ncbi:MAG: hypothetical protein AAGA96_12905 [Verrucomicrobiota bacterium]